MPGRSSSKRRGPVRQIPRLVRRRPPRHLSDPRLGRTTPRAPLDAGDGCRVSRAARRVDGRPRHVDVPPRHRVLRVLRPHPGTALPSGGGAVDRGTGGGGSRRLDGDHQHSRDCKGDEDLSGASRRPLKRRRRRFKAQRRELRAHQSSESPQPSPQDGIPPPLPSPPPFLRRRCRRHHRLAFPQGSHRAHTSTDRVALGGGSYKPAEYGSGGGGKLFPDSAGATDGGGRA